MESLTGVNPRFSGADRWMDAAIYVLVQGKFITLFSLLFGMGFAVMLERANAAGASGTALYARRLLALLGYRPGARDPDLVGRHPADLCLARFRAAAVLPPHAAVAAAEVGHRACTCCRCC